MNFPPLLSWPEIHKRLPVIFPAGLRNREHSIWEISARTIFVMLYAGAVEGRGQWLRPDQVTRMTDDQAAQTDDAARLAWGSYAWFASEPDRLVLFSDRPMRLRGG